MNSNLKDSRNPMYLNLMGLLDDYFPNYEIFHDNFIQILKGDDNHWRDDTYEYIEELGISDYGVIKSISYINHVQPEIRVNDIEQRFKNSYFHFGLLFDTIDNILKCIVYTDQKLKENVDFIVRKNPDDLLSNYKKWIDNKYEKEFKKMVKFGMSRIYYYPQSNRDFLKLIVSDKQFREDYKDFIIQIKKYRNFFAHNPSIDIVTKSNRKYVIKRSLITENRTLTDVRKSIDINPNDFENPGDLLKNDLIESLRIINSLWVYMIDKMNEIKSDTGFNNLIYNYKR